MNRTLFTSPFKIAFVFVDYLIGTVSFSHLNQCRCMNPNQFPQWVRPDISNQKQVSEIPTSTVLIITQGLVGPNAERRHSHTRTLSALISPGSLVPLWLMTGRFTLI